MYSINFVNTQTHSWYTTIHVYVVYSRAINATDCYHQQCTGYCTCSLLAINNTAISLTNLACRDLPRAAPHEIIAKTAHCMVVPKPIIFHVVTPKLSASHF